MALNPHENGLLSPHVGNGKIYTVSLKKMYAMHVVKLGFAFKTYPSWQHKYYKR